MFELKLCPFCGEKACLFVNEGVRVTCSKCGAASRTLVDGMGPKGPCGCAVKSVIEAWNRRVVPKEANNADKTL